MKQKIKTIRDLIEYNANRSPDKIFLFFKEEKLSYKDFNIKINKIANGLLKLNVKKNDKICLLLPNMTEFLLSWFAINKIGAIMVPINIALKEKEVSYILNHSDANLIITTDKFLQTILNLKKETKINTIINIGKESFSNVLNYWEIFKDEDEDLKWCKLLEDDHVVYPYTSGTTGTPKGVMLTNRTYILTGKSYAETIGATQDDKIMTPNPLFHINAQCYSTMGSLSANASLVLLERFSASNIWKDVQKYKPTKMVLVLASASILYNRYKDGEDIRTSVEKIIAGGAPKNHYRDFEKKFSVKLQTIYSLTESPLGIMSPKDGISKDGGIGYPMKPPKGYGENIIKIVDEKNEEKLPNEIGEIIIKNQAVMDGYYKDPKATKAVLKNGFLYTGDRGYKDEEGYFFFVGRGKDILRKKGENISAIEVESVINSHPKVKESAVVGIPSDYGDDEIKAFVVVKENETISDEEIINWCLETLADFKVPRVIEYIDELPKNAMGRVMKNKLIEKDLKISYSK
ncbi:MAG: hypothetical protein DRG20_06580 [Deltaproteobacteria bacterium]|nr:MAG: hypothetical protein DRG20_06580 [Deltaproteobacteria bacterium]